FSRDWSSDVCSSDLGKKAFAVLMANNQDFEQLTGRSELVYPPIDFLKRVYQCLANYYQLAVGSNMLSSFDFDLSDFCQTYNLVEIGRASCRASRSNR